MVESRKVNPLWIALPIVAFLLIGLFFLLRISASGSSTSDAVTDTAGGAAANTVPSSIQDRWQAVDRIGDSHVAVQQLVSKPAPQRVLATDAVPNELSGAQCPEAQVNPGVAHPSQDQVTFRMGQNQGPSVTVSAGTATTAAQCGVFAQLTGQTYVEVGSDAALCLQAAASTSSEQTCASAQDRILSSSGAISLAGPYKTISVLDTANFLKQWNDCPGCNLRGADLSGVTLRSSANLTNADLSGATLYNSSFSQSILRNAKFGVFNNAPAQIAMADLSDSLLEGTVFDSTVFYRADLTGGTFNCPNFTNIVGSEINFAGGEWQGGCANPQFSKAILNFDSIDLAIWPKLYLYDSAIYTDQKTFSIATQKDLGSTRLVDSIFIGLPPKLNQTGLQNTTLDQSTFFLSDLSNAIFNADNTSLVDTDFSGTNLMSADFRGIKKAAAQFTGANLLNAKFDGATLSSDMSNANFQSTSLAGVSMRDVTGTQVNFAGSYLWPGAANASFDGSKLRQANFSGALLGQTTFAGQTDLTGANFAGAQCISCDFTQAHLESALFDSAYIYGSKFAGADLKSASFTNAACCDTSTWTFSVPVSAAAPNISYDDGANPLAGGEFDAVNTCPNGRAGQKGSGCQGETEPGTPPTAQPACTSAAEFSCPQDILTIAGNGTAGYDGGGVQRKAKDAEFNNPTRLLLDNVQPRVIISDTGNHRLRAVSGLSAPEPTIVDFAGNGTSGSSGDGDSALNAELVTPMGLTQFSAHAPADRAGAIAVADAGAHNIRMIDSGNISTLAGTGSPCAQATGSCGDGQNARSANLTAPQGIWADVLGNLYIADTGNHKIRKVDFDTRVISTVAGTGSTAPGPSSNAVTCEVGQPATSSALNRPVDVTGDAMGNLYIVDQGANAVLKVDPRGCLTTFADAAKGLKSPTSVSVDHQNQIFVANSGANSVVTFSVWGVPNPVAGNGSAGFSGDGASSLKAELNGAQGVSTSTGGVLYIADTVNQRVRLSQSPH